MQGLSPARNLSLPRASGFLGSIIVLVHNLSLTIYLIWWLFAESHQAIGAVVSGVRTLNKSAMVRFVVSSRCEVLIMMYVSTQNWRAPDWLSDYNLLQEYFDIHPNFIDYPQGSWDPLDSERRKLGGNKRQFSGRSRVIYPHVVTPRHWTYVRRFLGALCDYQFSHTL